MAVVYAGLNSMHGPRKSLRYLDIRNNRIAHLPDLQALASCQVLQQLHIGNSPPELSATSKLPQEGSSRASKRSSNRPTKENPVVLVPSYREAVTIAFPGIEELDGVPIQYQMPPRKVAFQDQPSRNTAKAHHQGKPQQESSERLHTIHNRLTALKQQHKQRRQSSIRQPATHEHATIISEADWTGRRPSLAETKIRFDRLTTVVIPL